MSRSPLAAGLVVSAFLAFTARAADEPATNWFRGNTHAHTVLCGHADSEPSYVVRWYFDRGYHFLCLSEHNRFIDPATVTLPADARKDFLLIPGQEITGDAVHMTGLNIDKLVGHLIRGPNGKVIQHYVDVTRQVGGTPIINHPNFRWALQVADIRPANNCFLMEVWNGTPHVNNLGDATRISTEQMWDELLTDGMRIYGVASDDMHQLKVLGLERSNPGRGWVMVRAAELTPDAISAAMERGEFYSSTGVVLGAIELTDSSVTVSVDEAATATELAKRWVIGDPMPVGTTAELGYVIEFIGPSGKVLSSKNGVSATHPRDPSVAYVRARVSLVRDLDGQLRRFRAWTQPVFQDGRAKPHADR